MGESNNNVSSDNAELCGGAYDEMDASLAQH